MKVQYIISWIGFIFIWSLFIELFLANYGKNTSDNTEKKKGVLNKSWQKFAFIQGSIFGDLTLIIVLIDIIFFP